jgi:hypothetical protein
MRCSECFTEHEVDLDAEYDACHECGKVFCRKCKAFVDLDTEATSQSFLTDDGCSVVDYYCGKCDSKIFSADF